MTFYVHHVQQFGECRVRYLWRKGCMYVSQYINEVFCILLSLVSHGAYCCECQMVIVKDLLSQMGDLCFTSFSQVSRLVGRFNQRCLPDTSPRNIPTGDGAERKLRLSPANNQLCPPDITPEKFLLLRLVIYLSQISFTGLSYSFTGPLIITHLSRLPLSFTRTFHSPSHYPSQ